jgi:multisubunit Na+/H+ antiporter MnhG subunit
LTEKITPEHIDKMLDIQSRQVDHDRSDRTEARTHRVTLVVIGCLFALVLVGLLIYSDNDAIVEKVIIALISLVAGGFGGYGIGVRAREE